MTQTLAKWESGLLPQVLEGVGLRVGLWQGQPGSMIRC